MKFLENARLIEIGQATEIDVKNIRFWNPIQLNVNSKIINVIEHVRTLKIQ